MHYYKDMAVGIHVPCLWALVTEAGHLKVKHCVISSSIPTCQWILRIYHYATNFLSHLVDGLLEGSINICVVEKNVITILTSGMCCVNMDNSHTKFQTYVHNIFTTHCTQTYISHPI